MIGVKRSGKTRISTHTLNPHLTPTVDTTKELDRADSTLPESNVKVQVRPAPKEPEAKRAVRLTAEYEKETNPFVKDGSAFPLIEGGSPEKAQQPPKNVETPKEEGQAEFADIADQKAYPSLGQVGKPIAPVPATSAMRWTQKVPEQEAFPALGGASKPVARIPAVSTVPRTLKIPGAALQVVSKPQPKRVAALRKK